MKQLLIWRLWRYFSNPPAANQIYIRLYHTPESSRSRSAVIALGCGLALFVLSGAIAVLVLLLPFLSPIVGGVWVFGIAGVLRQHVTIFLDDMGATPDGTLGNLTNAALGVIHREGRFHGLVSGQLGIARTIASAVIALLMMWWLVIVPLNALSGVVFFSVYALLIVFIRWGYYLVHIYCCTVGILVGILAATFRQSRLVLQLGGILVYTVIMTLMTLFMAVFAAFTYNGALMWVNTWVAFLAALAGTGIVLSLVFVLLAEMTTRGLWWGIVRRLHAPTDAQILLGSL